MEDLEQLIASIPRGEGPRHAGFTVQGCDVWVMTRDAAHQHAERLAELGTMTGWDLTPESVRAESGSRGTMYGKFEHSLFATDDTGYPIALVGGNEMPPDSEFADDEASLAVFVLAVDPAWRNRGFARELCQMAMNRSLRLGFVELVTDAEPRFVCHVEDDDDHRFLLDFYGSLGFREHTRRTMDDRPVVVMRYALSSADPA